MSKFPDIALLSMNGIVLCSKHHYENDEAWRGQRYKPTEFLSDIKPPVLIFFIPHKLQAYNTVGNWEFTKDGLLAIFISRMKSDISEIAIALHEWIEAVKCRKLGIRGEDVTAFDIKFEKERHAEDEEPGNDPRAPYHNQHVLADHLERAVCRALGLNWKQHEKNVEQTT